MNWDDYFHNLAQATAQRSPCKRRQIGAVLARHRRVISTGYNGPPVGVPHCTTCRRAAAKDPRRCPAVHAEVNAVLAAPSAHGCTLYLTCEMPCKDCLSVLINVGVAEVVVERLERYDYLSGWMLQYCDVRIREYC